MDLLVVCALASVPVQQLRASLMHTYFWLSGKTIKAFGLKQTPALHKAGAVGHAVAAVALGIYAWGETAEANPAGALAEGKTVANVG